MMVGGGGVVEGRGTLTNTAIMEVMSGLGISAVTSDTHLTHTRSKVGYETPVIRFG